MTEFLSADYWNERYLNNASQWDLGTVSPPLKKYIDQLLNKDCHFAIIISPPYCLEVSNPFLVI